MVNTRTTYILWFFFGLTGLHHLYLGRLYHAIVWFATLGGFGMGWIRDFWRIPEYVKYCSPEKASRKKYLQRAISKTKPECGTFRHIGMVVMGSIFSIALGALVPDFSELRGTNIMMYHFLNCVHMALQVLGNAIGVYLVANIGEFKCSLYYPLISSLSIIPVVFLELPFMIGNSICVYVTKNKGLQWRSITPEAEKDRKGRKKFCKDLVVYLVACMTWLLIVVFGFYLNGAIKLEGHERILGNEAIKSIFSSDSWRRAQDALKQLNQVTFWQVWDEVKTQFDLTGRIKAYRVLGVFPGTSQEKISKRCRKYMADFHPDRFKVPAERKEAEIKFLEIQQACSRLSATRSQKLREN